MLSVQQKDGLHGSCSQLDWHSNATLQRSRAGSRLTQALSLSRMPHADGVAAALTNYQESEGSPPQKQRHGSTAATCIPPTPETAALGHRVEHLSATQDGSLVSIICRQLQLPEGFVHDLIHFGAVYWCPVSPALSPARAAHLDDHHLSRLESQREAAISKFGRQSEMCHPQRATQDVSINQHAFIRVHVHPKRFPAVYTVNWKECVVHSTDDYVVVHKPAGVQVAPTVDNLLENVLACTAQALQCKQPLLITHRLDACTEGLLVVGCSLAFVQHFNRLLQEPGAVRKYYKALTQRPPPLVVCRLLIGQAISPGSKGRLVHYLTTERAKGQPAHSRVHQVPCPGSHMCSLEVMHVQAVTVVDAVAAEWGSVAYESHIELHTGRTHQIRAQLAAEGFPLYGDTLYTSLALGASPQARLQETTGACGLQACRMEVVGSTMMQQPSFQAKTPWWSAVQGCVT